MQLGVMAHACNLSTVRPRWEDCLSPGVQDQPGQHSEILSIPKKQNKIKQKTGCDPPIFPAIWEAEVGGSLEPRK